MTSAISTLAVLSILTASAALSGVEPPALIEKPGLVVSVVSAPPTGAQVIVSQPYGSKGPTSIRYLPLSERELKEGHNPADPAGGRYFVRDRDLGQTFTAPPGGPWRLDAVTVRLGPVSDQNGVAAALGAKVSLQILAVSGEPRIIDNGTVRPGLTVSKGYPGVPQADDYIVGEDYSSLLVASGGRIPAEVRLGTRNTMRPTANSSASLLRWDITAAGGVALEAGRTYAFMLCFDEPAPGRGLPFDNWDYLNDAKATPEQRQSGPYAGGHRLRREGRVAEPWNNLARIFDDRDPANAHFPLARAARFALPPGTWGRPDVDTWADLTFWIEATATAQ